VYRVFVGEAHVSPNIAAVIAYEERLKSENEKNDDHIAV
jgi:hypothetical protein